MRQDFLAACGGPCPFFHGKNYLLDLLIVLIMRSLSSPARSGICSLSQSLTACTQLTQFLLDRLLDWSDREKNGIERAVKVDFCAMCDMVVRKRERTDSTQRTFEINTCLIIHDLTIFAVNNSLWQCMHNFWGINILFKLNIYYLGLVKTREVNKTYFACVNKLFI